MGARSNFLAQGRASQGVTANRLLAALPGQELARLIPALENVSLAVGQVLHQPGSRQEFAYFPTSAVISLLYLMESGASSEIAMTGYEGVVGLPSFLGGETMANQAVVQNSGRALRIKAAVLKSEFHRGGSLHSALLRYTMSLITQMSQTAVCNRLHHLDKQVCRWLLLTHDRVHTDELAVTQDLIAGMLGVRREGVSVAAGHLQRAGIIHYSRGRITILNRPELEERACECYHVIKNEGDRLLGTDLANAVNNVGHFEKRVGHGRRLGDNPLPGKEIR